MPDLGIVDARWAYALGAEGAASSAGVAVSGQDTVVVGAFAGQLVVGDTRLVGRGPADAFIARLDRDGRPLWAGQVGGDGDDRATCVAAGPEHLVVGVNYTPPLPLGDRVVTGDGRPDAAVLAFDPAGRLLWSQPILSSRHVHLTALAVADSGEVTAAGWFSGTVRLGPHVLTSAGAGDIFVARFGADGAPGPALRLGGPGPDLVHGLALVDAEIAIAGRLGGRLELGGRFLDQPGAFVARLGRDGAVTWFADLGPSAGVAAVHADPDGALYIAGSFQDQIEIAGEALSSRGETDIFAARFDPGGDLVWLTQLGGSAADSARALRWTGSGLVLAGTFAGRIDAGGRELVSAGAQDLLIAKLRPDSGATTAARRFGGPGYDDATALAATTERDLVIAGSFEEHVEVGAARLTATGSRTALVAGVGL
ncbi:hypothetical protein [Haliangium sp.]|uniref:hypothetical protein n=1 Tax=Haliangium sp. TaxID=2663208 RepID=UPI003D114600